MTRRSTIRRHATRDGSEFLVLTHRPQGDLWGTDAGAAISPAKARELQGDLFVRPSNDGLFPGMSQTWRREG